MADPVLLRGTYATVLGRGMLAFALARGFEEAAVLRIMQVARAVLDDPDARLPVGPALDFWEHVVRTLDDPGVPVQFAEHVRASDFGGSALRP